MDLDVTVLRSVCSYDGYESTDQVVLWCVRQLVFFNYVIIMNTMQVLGGGRYVQWLKESEIDSLPLIYSILTDEEKKKLLAFATGTDRVPIGGLANTKFVIAKQVIYTIFSV